MNWQDVIAYFEQLPHSSLVWHDARQLVRRLQELLDHRDACEREAARSALALLREECVHELRFFGYEAIVSGKIFPSDDVGIASRLDEIRSSLIRYRTRRGFPARSIAEERARRTELDVLEGEICRQLRQIFEGLTSVPAVMGEPLASVPLAVSSELLSSISDEHTARPPVDARPANEDVRDSNPSEGPALIETGMNVQPAVPHPAAITEEMHQVAKDVHTDQSNTLAKSNPNGTPPSTPLQPLSSREQEKPLHAHSSSREKERLRQRQKKLAKRLRRSKKGFALDGNDEARQRAGIDPISPRSTAAERRDLSRMLDEKFNRLFETATPATLGNEHPCSSPTNSIPDSPGQLPTDSATCGQAPAETLSGSSTLADAAMPCQPGEPTDQSTDVEHQDLTNLVHPSEPSSFDDGSDQRVRASQIDAVEKAIFGVPPGPELKQAHGGTVEQSDESHIQPILEPAPLQRAGLDFLCEALRSEDLAGAYWVLRSLEAMGCDAPISPWLPAAVLAARQPLENLAIADDLMQLATDHVPANDEPSMLLAVSAALLPTLTQPLVAMQRWLEVSVGPPRFREIVNAVQQFADRGAKIDFHQYGKQLSREGAEQQVQETVAEARRWLDNAPSRTTSYQRATRIWRHLAQSEEFLPSFLAPILQDRRAQLARVNSETNQWSQRANIVSRVQAIDAELRKTRHAPVEGSALDQIVSWVFEACELARRWCRRVEQLQRMGGGSNWLDQQIGQLRGVLSDSLPDAIGALNALSATGDSLLAASAQVATRSMSQMAALFSIQLQATVDAPLVVHGGDRPEQRSLFGILARRLWHLPSLELNDDGEPHGEDGLRLVLPALLREARSRPTIAVTLEGWLRRQDLRFTDDLLAMVQDPIEFATLRQRVTEGRDAISAQLADRREAVQELIHNGLIDGVISETQRSEHLSRLNALEEPALRNYAAAIRACDEVQTSLLDAYAKYCDEQIAQWHSERDQLVDPLQPDARQRMESLMDAAIERRDVRLIHEYLSQLHSARQSGRLTFLDSPAPLPDIVRTFLDCQEQLNAAAVEQPKRKEGGFARILDMAGVPADLPPARREEACRALEAWDHMSRKPFYLGDQRLRTSLPTVVEFLGLDIDRNQSAVEMVGAKRNWAHVRVAASDRQLSLVPQFGSLSQGSYDILCVWDNPSPQSLSTTVQEAQLQQKPTLVLYFDRLALPQRSNVGRIAVRDQLKILVVDELLLLFLARQAEERWPDLQCIALPFTAINPYLPRRAGNVPSEMFFGRKEMLAAILDFTGAGTCVVYGGRQLGKSALLRRAQQTFHNPDQNSFAIYEEIRNLGDPLADKPAELIWTVLRDELNREFFDKPISAEQPDAVIRHIRNRLDEVPQARLLILLDEADSFLEQDAEQNFRHVSELKKLMEGTDRRVKVVFAGLHNVQRFQSIPNQPFAHLGSPLEVGPLEPAAAKDLVQAPIETVGYRFEDESLVLKILSYTNFHPGLIQLFGWRLLNELQQRPRTKAPPYLIGEDAVRKVYGRAETQREIRDRFNWTLQLDARYNALIWTILNEELERTTAVGGVYAPAYLHERLRAWWPAAFAPMPCEQVRGLLDELCGLGILLRIENGYRLRSPNLMHLIGDTDEIRTKLMELEQCEAPSTGFKADRHRMLLGRSGHRSPFTYAQSRQLARPRFGAGLVFGSPALGMGDLQQAVAHLVPALKSGQGAAHTEEFRCETVAAWEKQLRTFLERHRDRERLILAVEFGTKMPDVAALVNASLDFCRSREKSERRWMRVLHCLDPNATWTWFQQPDVVRARLEAEVDAVARLGRWDEEAVVLHLKQLDKMTIPGVVTHLMDISGGWPKILHEVFDRCGEENPDPRPAADQIARELTSGGLFRGEFRRDLGLGALPKSDVLCGVLNKLAQDNTFEAAFLPMMLEEEGVPELADPHVVEFLLQLQVIENAGAKLQVNRQVAQVLTPK